MQQQKSAGTVMLLIAFFDCKDMIYQHFFPPGAWVNEDYYFLTSINFTSTSEENIWNWFVIVYSNKTMIVLTWLALA